MTPTRPRYQGSRRKLVLAFDVGTTYSGISYSILDPGQVPEIKSVTRYPAHEHISGASKIPTIIYYDRRGTARAIGAEAMREGIYEIAEEEAWIKAEWFKLHLRANGNASQNVTDNIPPLPLNKTVIEVISDLLRYLQKCASSYIQDTHANGADLWSSVKKEIHYVLSHPNGWEGREQSQMRRAAVLAGLIKDTEAGHSRLSFVTEGEASLHFSIHNGLPSSAMEDGEGIVVVDAGGGTIDLSAYKRGRGADKKFSEISVPQCHFHGSIFVTINARQFLERYLAESQFLDDLDHIIECFDKTTKLKFQNINGTQYIKFGSTRDNDPACNIRFGQLKLAGSDVAPFFQPSVDCIVKAVMEQKTLAHEPVSHVVLVGGFASSDWLFAKVHEALTPHGLNVLRPENHLSKAVSDGAISFHLDHHVTTRVSKFAYGTFSRIAYDPKNPEHQKRKSTLAVSASGEKRVVGIFHTILPKSTQVSEVKEFRRVNHQRSDKKSTFKRLTTTLVCYRGAKTDTAKMWRDVEPGMFTRVCSIEMDLSHLPLVAQPKLNGESGMFYEVEYETVLLFGLTELKAQIAWKENGVEKRSTVRIVYEPETQPGRG